MALWPLRFATASVLLAAGLAVAGCGRQAAETTDDRGSLPRAIPVSVLADSGGATSLRVAVPREPDSTSGTPDARVWLDRVAVASGAASPPLPEAAPDTSTPVPAAGGLTAEEKLLAPIPRSVATLRSPPGARGGRVELDVLVDVLGRVVDARWAGGDRDTARVRAAIECAERMTFYPALLRGRPVEVWCRQRFEFGR